MQAVTPYMQITAPPYIVRPLRVLYVVKGGSASTSKRRTMYIRCICGHKAHFLRALNVPGGIRTHAAFYASPLIHGFQVLWFMAAAQGAFSVHTAAMLPTLFYCPEVLLPGLPEVLRLLQYRGHSDMCRCRCRHTQV